MTKEQHKAIELLWRNYRENLLMFIKSRVKNSQDSEDILQEVFLKILNKIDSLRDNTKLLAWLYRITRNAIIDHYRGNRNSDELPGMIPFEAMEEEQNMMQEVQSWIIPIINVLPGKYKEALLYSEIEGLSQTELAKKLNISYSGAKSRIQRGRAMLKERLTECCTFNVDVYGNILDYGKKQEKCKKS
jgi:RNA polymerase sigma-70 factor (ECF subfamily)